MRFLTTVAGLLIFLFVVDCVHANQGSKEEIVFIRKYREYGWKEYGADGVRFPHPIQTLVDFYLVEYRLDATHLTLTKMSASRPPVRTVLLTVSLNRVQRRAAQKGLRTANPSLIQQQCNSNTVIIDDGFHLNVTLTKSDTSQSFSWDGNYVRELVEFLDVINEVSPEKYRFYKSGQQEAFKQSLLHATENP